MFKKTTEEFLRINFCYLYQKAYINIIIKEIIPKLTGIFIDILNKKVEKELINNNEIQRLINKCLLVKLVI